jgi:hypothetical protein
MTGLRGTRLGLAVEGEGERFFNDLSETMLGSILDGIPELELVQAGLLEHWKIIGDGVPDRLE